MASPPIDVPAVDVDYYGREALLHPDRIYEQIREPGPVVWLRRHGVLVVARFDELRELLRAPDQFTSRQGVSMNAVLNRPSRTQDATLVTEGEQHARLRRSLVEPMRPRALEAIRPDLQREVSICLDRVVGCGPVEAMTTIAQHLPVAIVSKMVGLPERARLKMLDWSKATFNAIGPFNWRTVKSVPALFEMLRTIRTVRETEIQAGTWIERLFSLAAEGEVSHGEMRGMIVDYVAPSLDTTVFATGHMLNRLARHPEAWEALLADRSLVPGAVDESLRIDSVIRSFTRVSKPGAKIGTLAIPPGQRIVACYGGANLDPRRYPDPGRFEVTRDARDHLAFGHGPHACAGTRLARLEMETLLEGLLDRVERIEPHGDPTSAWNNTLFGFASLPLALPARS